MSISRALTNVPGLLPLKQSIYRHFGWGDIETGSTRVQILQAFPAYAPNSSGGYRDRSDLTISTIQKIFPAIESLINTVATSSQDKPLSLDDPKTFAEDLGCCDAALHLGGIFDHYGSDKAKTHDYHFIYSSILGRPDAVRRILEIGLGSNNEDVVSSMGANGRPGASLRAFRDYCGNAHVFGADIDSRILFQEDRISTYQVDQVSVASLNRLSQQLPKDFDLIIDDGLHSPDANINTLAFAIPLIRKGGWIVIEDIAKEAIPIWQSIASILNPRDFRTHLFNAYGGIVFAVQKQ